MSENRNIRIIKYISLAVLLCLNIFYGVQAIKPLPVEDDADRLLLSTLPAITDLNEITEALPMSVLSQIEQYDMERQTQRSVENQNKTDEYTEEELAAIKRFYSETVFVGDSVMLGYRSYAMAYDSYGVFSSSLMLASSGYSTVNANQEISGKTIHPYYKGLQRYVWDSIKLFGGKRVILCFWANEFSRGNLDRSMRNMEELVCKIREENPGIEVYIISPCYRFNGNYVGVEELTNENITQLAQSQKEFCKKVGAGYIDISRFFGNEVDGMYEEYTKDEYVHMNNNAYELWSELLMQYALGRELFVDNGHS